MLPPSVTESRDVNASATRIFALLSNPAQHPQIDGTGMLRAAGDAKVISAVGDLFYMSMVHWDMGNYVMENQVVEFEKDRLIAWEPTLYSAENPVFQKNVGGRTQQRWGWQLEPLSEQSTRVTEFFDCRRCPEGLRSYIKDGEFWRMAMLTSLFHLDKLATGI